MDELTTPLDTTGASTLEYELDPVCLAFVSEAQAREHDLVVAFEERDYVFCSSTCQRTFARAPTYYAVAGRSAP